MNMRMRNTGATSAAPAIPATDNIGSHFPKWRQAVVPVLLGILAAMVILGYRVLEPGNIGWLEEGDPSSYFLGWSFFRHSQWHFPIGMNPDYGLELGNGIIFSDANPLLAIIFKLLSPILPATFQYFGLWLLICLILQSCLSWKLAGLFHRGILFRSAVALLFLFAPPMILRMMGHFNLAAHFLILAAIYLAIRDDRKNESLYWVLTISAATLVHPYILLMCAVVWGGSLADRLRTNRKSLRETSIEAATVIIAVGLLSWQSGYFGTAGGAAIGGFGTYRMNLLSVIDPSGWSHLPFDIPEGEGDYEGFNFLGVGGMLLVAAALSGLVLKRDLVVSYLKKHAILAVCLIFLTVYALSNNVGVGSESFTYSMPAFTDAFTNTFRASGRMFWPVYYTILVCSVGLVTQTYDRRIFVPLICFLGLIQAADTSAGYLGLRAKYMSEPRDEWYSPMKSQFWNAAAKKYSKARWIQPGNLAPRWKEVAAFASLHGMETDAVYLSRVDSAEVEELRLRAEDALSTGKFPEDTLFFLDDESFNRARNSVDTKTTWIGKIDGFNVVAPNWFLCAKCVYVTPEDSATPAKAGLVQPSDLPPSGIVNAEVRFNAGSDGATHLGAGWSSPEAWGTWSLGKSAELQLEVPPGAKRLTFLFNALVNASHPTQSVEVHVNGTVRTKVDLTLPGDNVVDVPIAAGDTRPLKIMFLLPNATTPQAIGVNADTRQLAIGILSVKVR